MTSFETTTVSAIIPTHNRADVLCDMTLASLAQVIIPTQCSLEVVVIANACSDDTVEAVERLAVNYPHSLRVIADPVANLNRARNTGVRESQGQILALLDDDVWLYPEWLVGMLEVYRDFPAELVSGRATLWWKDVDRPAWVDRYVEDLLSHNDLGDDVREARTHNEAIGANFSFRRQVYDSIGGFIDGLDRTATVLLGGGESEFIARARARGFRMYYSPQMAVRHWVAPHRIEQPYLTGVAFGSAQSRVYMKPTMTLTGGIRSLVGNSYLACRHGASELIAAALGRTDQARFHRLRRYNGWGGVVGLWNRMLGRSPVRHGRPTQSA
ncbi:MAG: glycosyltransferase family 2 protein [Planctomycetales bacterium]|nr:glycosyltransferase family 2 protein [Planctomycetales bacterium]